MTFSRDNVDEELLRAFLEDARELIDNVNAQLLELEESSFEDDEVTEVLLRDLHSLKGSAQTVGLESVKELVHTMESIVENLVDAGSFSTEDVDRLFDGVDAVDDVVRSLNEGDGDIQTSDLNELKSNLETVLAVDSAEESPDEEKVKNPEEPGEDYLGDGESETVWDPEDHETMVPEFLAEARTLLEEITNALIELEQNPSQKNLETIFRSAHTLKGNAGMIGLTSLENLSHSMEELLDELRDGDRDVTGEIIDLLLICNDQIEYVLDQIEEYEPVEESFEDLLQVLDRARKQGTIQSEWLDELSDDTDESGETEEKRSDEESEDRAEDTSVTDSIRVGIPKLDEVINLVGELLINKRRLDQNHDKLEELELSFDDLRQAVRTFEKEGNAEALHREIDLFENVFEGIREKVTHSSEDLDRVASNLQEAVMRTRMVPLANLFKKFPRLVRDLSRQSDKSVDLEISGEDTEIDKTVIETISDPLMHIIRNCVDHGIEPSEERVEQGKPETGTIEIDAGYEGDMVVISVSDDGGGIDWKYVSEKALEKGIVSQTELEEMDVDERKQLIFEPGFSTRTETTETSGRGVGMDVVKSNVLDLNGSIDVDSELGQGTTFELRLPLTLAIVEVLLVEVGQRQYSLPLTSVQEVIQVDSDQINPIGQRRVFELRGETLSLLHLDEILGWADRVDLNPENSQVVIAQSGEERIGIMVDDLLEKREIVIKDLGSILDNVPYVSGATIMGNGDVVLILDAASVVQNVDDLESYAVQPAESSTESETTSSRILLVEDIRSQRLKLKNILESSGHRVDEASSGEEALSQVRQVEYDLVSTDVRMPGINGYELTRKLRSMDSYRDVPIVMVSTLDEEIDKERGFTAGADEYVEKPFNEEQLTEVVRSLLADFSG